MVARSTRGPRTIPADDFFQGMMTTALAEDELLVETRLPVPSPDMRFGFYEFDTEDYFEQRRDNFLETLRRAGCPCEVFCAGRRETPACATAPGDKLSRTVAARYRGAAPLVC